MSHAKKKIKGGALLNDLVGPQNKSARFLDDPVGGAPTPNHHTSKKNLRPLSRIKWDKLSWGRDEY